MEKENIVVYVDESGTISKGAVSKDDYFIIALLFIKAEDEDFIKKIFKKARLKLVDRKPELKGKLVNNREIKGAELSETQKLPIYTSLAAKCKDQFELGLIIMNNKETDEKFRSNSSRVFNYLIKTYLKYDFQSNSVYRNPNVLHFFIDERNVVTESKYTLQEYLNTELNLLATFTEEDISVRYHDSKNFLLLQMTDFIANTFYRKMQKNNREAERNAAILKGWISTKKAFVFPADSPAKRS